jgi:hypothetical protein
MKEKERREESEKEERERERGATQQREKVQDWEHNLGTFVRAALEMRSGHSVYCPMRASCGAILYGTADGVAI